MRPCISLQRRNDSATVVAGSNSSRRAQLLATAQQVRATEAPVRERVAAWFQVSSPTSGRVRCGRCGLNSAVRSLRADSAVHSRRFLPTSSCYITRVRAWNLCLSRNREERFIQLSHRAINICPGTSVNSHGLATNVRLSSVPTRQDDEEKVSRDRFLRRADS